MSLTLLKAIEGVPQSRISIVAGSESFTYRELITKANVLRKEMVAAKGTNVALHCLDPLELVLTLIALDGVASQILLLSPSLSPETADNLSKLSKTKYRLLRGKRQLQCFDAEEDSHPPPTSWILATSGTTGTPKLIEHSLETLTRTVKSDYQCGAEYVWGLIYDANRFAGLQVVLQSLFSGSTLVTAENADFGSQIDAIIANRVNALSATPSLWRKLLMDGRIAKLPLRQITLGGEIADQSILDALQGRFPDARLVHIYASTEAGTGFAVNDGLAGFPSAWLDDPRHSPGLRVNSENHLLIKTNLMPRGPEIISRLDEDGYLDTQDLVNIDGERILFAGRASGAINVGGNKVTPEYVESYLLSLDGIADARVFGKRSSLLGALVGAEIVPERDLDLKALRQHIIQSCKKDLESWEVPALIRFTEDLPVNPAGKRTRLAT